MLHLFSKTFLQVSFVDVTEATQFAKTCSKSAKLRYPCSVVIFLALNSILPTRTISLFSLIKVYCPTLAKLFLKNYYCQCDHFARVYVSFDTPYFGVGPIISTQAISVGDCK